MQSSYLDASIMETLISEIVISILNTRFHGRATIYRLVDATSTNRLYSSFESEIEEAATFSLRCSRLPVPGIGSITSECLSNHASAIWYTVALCASATVWMASIPEIDPAAIGKYGYCVISRGVLRLLPR